MMEKIVTLDVREDLRAGRDPFARIMEAVRGLEPDQELLLIAPFEPAPLFAVLARMGFSHHATPTQTGDWEVLFSRSSAPTAAGTQPPATSQSHCGCGCAPSSAKVVEVDARGLEPPQPLVKILEALARLPPGASLRARTDRRPMHLYARLDERGFLGESEEQSDGSFITHIRRR
jgi:uncharacterized protein (DUF2249 family)